MSRLADYFVIVGYDHDDKRNGTINSKILQRFPQNDWDDCPFTIGLELFCQPSGCSFSTQQQQPVFYVAVLTNVDADRRFCAIFTFYERVNLSTTKPDDVDSEEHDGTLVHQHTAMYAPKSFVLVSKSDYFEVFRNCLGVVYTAFVENMQVQLETLVGNILGCVQVPPPGGPQVRFSIGGGDWQALQPALSATLPVSHDSVALLFDQIGINNAITVFCAALTEHKILFYSDSYCRLTAACRAISALHFPLKYSYVYIPILPSALLEVLSTPTPFIAGVHASLKSQVIDLLDVIFVDLDGGDIRIPECVTIPTLPDHILNRVKKSLNMLILPELHSADCAYPTSEHTLSAPVHRDKEIRAVFIRMFAELLTGYRSNLVIIRIHPEPFITFHRAKFLGQHGFVEEEFALRVLGSMGFDAFVTERGHPYRACDIFDEVYASILDHLRQEHSDPDKMFEHIKRLSQHLHLNENPNPQQYNTKVPRPTDGAHSRIYQPPFPKLNAQLVDVIIADGMVKLALKKKLNGVKACPIQIVPMGPFVTSVSSSERLVENSARKLDVLRSCINYIFENRISDARVIFPAVLRALKSCVVRLALTQELNHHVLANRAMLEQQQFDLVVRLLNCALQNESSIDENGIAYNMLPLATAFCRKLSTGIIQFAYTCFQEHAVWASLSFWEQAFYQDVQREICQLYLPHHEINDICEKKYNTAGTFLVSNVNCNQQVQSWNRLSSTTLDKCQRPSDFEHQAISPLEIAAEQMRVRSTMTKAQLEEVEAIEESTVYSQAIHYANRIVYMRVPLDTNHFHRSNTHCDGESSSTITTSIGESDSYDAESGFDETEGTDVASAVTKFVTRFVDKVCSEGSVTSSHIKMLHQMIPGVISMHVETLEAVYKESKRLPPVQKPKVMTPMLLSGEEIVMEGLRAYLLQDGREEGLGGNLGGPSLIPAEGAVFLTTYRFIFKGMPCDPLVCEQVVIRAFPVSTLIKEKKISVHYMPHLDQWLQECLQLRANCFQLLKVAFDNEVGSDNVETLRKLLGKVRNPPSIFSTFAFTGLVSQPISQMHKGIDKGTSLRHFAKQTLKKTVRKAGLRTKPMHQKQKFVLPTSSAARKTTSPRSSDSESDKPSNEFTDDLSIVDEKELVIPSLLSDPKNLDRLMAHRSYQDYVRLGLGTFPSCSQRTRHEPFRLTIINSVYSVSRSYPAMVSVPQLVSDESIWKFARCHRHSRFPVITWRHPRTKGLLLRASAFQSRNPIGMLRHNPSSGSTSGEPSSNIEHEKYFMLLVNATPLSNRSSCYSDVSDSLTAFDYLMMAGLCEHFCFPDIPERFSQNVFSPGGTVSVPRRTGLLQSSQRQSFSVERGLHEKALLNQGAASHQHSATLDTRGELINHSMQELHNVALYVLGEKLQMKNIKLDAFPKCDFIPVDFYDVRHIKASFTKLLRACCPSQPSANSEHGYLQSVEGSEWLLQLQNIMQLAGAVVDLLDVQGASVMVCLEDGWDVTAQVVSVAEVLLDPHYRTLHGFTTLIEKEWLGFGHRFSHRSSQTTADQASRFAPVFLQFLDVVHQVLRQFPLSFEFNQYFLKFVAYHYVSSRFRTFMLDSECERVESGWLSGEPRSDGYDAEVTANRAGLVGKQGHTRTGMVSDLWDYIDRHHRHSPIFTNFTYTSQGVDCVLRPCSNISNLAIWDYYVMEDLAHGPSYDVELVTKEMHKNTEIVCDIPLDGVGNHRLVLNSCYDNITLQQPDCFRYMLQRLHTLEEALGYLPQRWSNVWETVQCPVQSISPSSSLFYTKPEQTAYSMCGMHSHGHSIHKRSTLEILVRGKILGEAARVVSQPHRFEKFAFTTVVHCDFCQQVLWGFSKTGTRCVDCGYSCHEKCQPSVPKTCHRIKPSSDPGCSTVRSSQAAGADVSAGAVVAGSAFNKFSSSSHGEHRTFEGYLSKQGAFFKQWKQRWFVLDSMKHQLRYYDTTDDSSYRGVIDLAEVETVQMAKSLPGAPKKAEENSFIEVCTVRRHYNFMAPSSQNAQQWVDKLQACQ